MGSSSDRGHMQTQARIRTVAVQRLVIRRKETRRNCALAGGHATIVGPRMCTRCRLVLAAFTCSVSVAAEAQVFGPWPAYS